MPKVRINEIIYDESSAKPAVVIFQNGDLLPHREQFLQCGVFHDCKNKNVAAVSSDEMLYAGQVSGQDEIYNNFIMTVDRTTSECKLIAVDTGLLKAVTNAKRKAADVPVPNNKLTAISDLNKEFGSKRTKRRTQQLERYQVNVENVKQDLEKTAVDVDIKESDLIPRTVEDNSEYKPTIHRDAARIEDVYVLDSLVPLELLATLQEKIDEILPDIESVDISAFVKKEILKLQKSLSDNSETKYQLLLYIDCLIKMLRAPAKTISTTRYTPCEYSKDISTYMLKHFTAPSTTGRTRPISMRDKCICYILVLIALACDYSVNLEGIAVELKLSVKKLSEIARVLAFSPSKDKKSVVTLKLPLPPPVTNTGRKRK